MRRARCVACGSELIHERIEITAIEDAFPRFIDGRWNACCGYGIEELVPCLGPLQGPPVPTPEDILRAAGIQLL